MEKPTIVSSGPDSMGRTVCFGDEMSRRARFGRIRPMPKRSSSFIKRITRALIRG